MCLSSPEQQEQDVTKLDPKITAEVLPPTMRAAVYREHGAADAVLGIEVIELSEPAPGEVLVEVHASGVNPSDVAGRSGGWVQPGLEGDRIVPHSDGAGVIVAIGKGVSPDRLGERVWLWNAQWGRTEGTAADYVALPSIQAVRLPENVTFIEAAAFGIPLLTAWRAVRLLDPLAGMVVLITGGAGSVAQHAIQLAKLAGATVITTVSGAKKAEAAKLAGADHVINYRVADVAAEVLTFTDGHGADAAIDLDIANNGTVLARALKPHGTLVGYGTSGPTAAFPAIDMIVKSLSVRFFIVYELTADVRREAEAALTRLLADGRLRTPVHSVLPLEQIAEAHRLIESGEAVGNVVLAVR
jgi:NADPH2:quinone reductase